MASDDNFIKQLEAMVQRNKQQRGYSGIPADELMELVRRDPDGAVRSVEVLLQHATDIDGGARFALQLAHGVAVAYEAVESDDSLSLAVKRRNTELGLEDATPRIQIPDGTDPIATNAAKNVLVQVDAETWMKSDPYTVVRIIRFVSDGEDRPALLRRSCGRFLILFDGLSHDQREVWEVPEIRTFWLRLVDIIPEIAFYLNFDREHGMLWMFYQCLAAPEATTPEGVHIYHPSFLTAVTRTLTRMRNVCQEAGIDWGERVAAILAQLPEDFPKRFLRSMESPPSD